MNDHESVHDALSMAKRMTVERLTRSPAYGPYQHALDQIILIETVIRHDGTPTNEQKDAIDIDLMAVKEFDDSDPQYSDALCKLSYLYKKLY